MVYPFMSRKKRRAYAKGARAVARFLALAAYRPHLDAIEGSA